MSLLRASAIVHRASLVPTSRIASISQIRPASTEDVPAAPRSKRKGPLSPPDEEDIDINAQSGAGQRPRPRISDSIHPPTDLTPEQIKHNEEVARRTAGGKHETVEKGFWTGQNWDRSST